MQTSRMLPSVLVLLAGHAAAQPVSWNNPAGGAWNIASNWDPTVVPNSGTAQVTLGLFDPYTVVCNFSPTISTLAITNPLATIDIVGGNSLFVIGGLLDTDGLIRINSNSTVFDASLTFTANTTATGTGEIRLGAIAGNPDILDAQLNANNSAVVSLGPDLLVSGNGAIGGSGSFVSHGTIRPTGPVSPGIQLRTALTLLPGAEIDLSEARFELGPNGILSGGRVFGIHPLRASATLNRVSDITLDAPLQIMGNNSVTALDGPITNNNTITLNPAETVFNALLRFDVPTTIGGAGSIEMRTAGSSDDAQITTLDGVTGTIDTDQHVTGAGRFLGSINLRGSATATNPSTNLEMRGSVEGTGRLRAENGAWLSFINASLTGLTIETETDGMVGAAVGTSTISNLTNNGHAVIAGGSTILSLVGDLTNNGTLTLNFDNRIFNAILRFDTNAQIDGSGQIRMRTAGSSDDAQITTGTGFTGTIGPGQSITGSGQFSGDIVLLGSATADDPTANLELRGLTRGPGLLRAENGAWLSFINASIQDFTIETETGGMVGAAVGTTTASSIVNNGHAVVAGGGTTLSLVGDLTNNGTLTLNFDNRVFNAVLRFDDSRSLLGNGTVRMITSGEIGDAQIVVTAPHTATFGSGQTIAGSGTITGPIVNHGMINADDPTQILDLRGNISGSGTVRADAGRATLTNATLTGHTLETANAGIVTARVGSSAIENTHNLGTLGIDGNGTTLAVRGTMINDGLILVNATNTAFNALLSLDDPSGIVGNGEINLQEAGSLEDAQIVVPAPQSSLLGPGQTLTGSGEIRGNLSVLGAIRPAGGARRLNAFSGLVSLAPTTSTTFEIGGTSAGQFGRITANNGASIHLDGACIVRFDDGYNPVRGDSWDIVSAQNRTGEFTSYDLPTAPFGLAYRVFYQPGRVFLRLTCSADFDGDNILNFFDVSTYLALFNAQDPRADLSAPFGVFNFFDIAAFINNFNAGCP